MLENNIKLPNESVKIRFYVQYWGTKTLYVGGVGLVEIGKGGYNLKHPDFFLILKPLSKAKKEHILKTFYMIKFDEYVENHKNDYIEAKEWFDNYGSDGYTKFNQEQTDFLRSNGYAIPFMDYSVDDLVSFGWIRFK